MASAAAKRQKIRSLGRLTAYPDVGVALLVVLIVGMMVIPLPTALLDILLALNITFAVVILLTTFYIQNALELAAFPSLLLVTTLFRLALNVSTTRLILLQGYAGRLINAFGNFVVGGNYVVGGVVFLILVLIQFLVITKGAERVAEVQARFQLDGMPGKQMAIDADLGNGLIDEQTAKERRKRVQREADFFGAMDGASKFVKGDAIAGLIITTINIIGGICIGIFQKGLTLVEAAQTYSLLTVGDGLVAQIPALLLSTATGILVTRSAGESDLGTDIMRSLTNHYRPLWIGAAMLLALAVVPGFPKIPFAALALFLWLQGRWVRESRKEALSKPKTEPRAAAKEGGAMTASPAASQKPEGSGFESVMKLLAVDPLELEVGYALIPMVEPSRGGDLLDRIQTLRRQMALDLGVVIPPIRIKDNLQLKPASYLIKVRGVPEKQADLLPDHFLAINTGNVKGDLVGIPTKDPSFGLDALWIAPELRGKAEELGYTVVDAASVLATHLSVVVSANAADLLTRQTVQNMVDMVRETSPAVVEDMLRSLGIGDVQKVLQNLVREKVPIRDLAGIFEVLADFGKTTASHDFLSEKVREALGRAIVSPLIDEEKGELTAVTLSPVWEREIRDSVQGSLVEGWRIKMAPEAIQRFASAVGQATVSLVRENLPQVLLVHPEVRFFARKILDRTFPNVVVLAYSEIPREIRLSTVGVVE